MPQRRGTKARRGKRLRDAQSGLGGPDNIEELHRRTTELEQQVVELRRQLGERDDDLDAARATNRELMTSLNRITRTPSP